MNFKRFQGILLICQSRITMKNMNLSELSQNDLIQINGGVDEVAYKAGYLAGEIVGKSIRNFLTLTGIWRLISLI